MPLKRDCNIYNSFASFPAVYCLCYDSIDLLSFFLFLIYNELGCCYRYDNAGLGNVIKRKSVWHFLKSSSVHIVFLQEIHAYSACETLWEKEWGGDILWNHGTTRSKGVAIAFK